jgi:hypothetical protein
MSKVDESLSAGEVWAATLRTIRVHGPRSDGSTGRCVNCPPVGPCGVLWWAWHERLRREAAAAARLRAFRLGEAPTTPQA